MSGNRLRFTTKILAALLVGWASLRVSFWSRRVALIELPARLRRVRRIAPPLGDPDLLARTARRLQGALPPRRLGPCLRQSLLLVDLLSRCGLEARVHCGLRRAPGGVSWEGHAWVSVRGRPVADQPIPSEGFEEVWAA